jgi:hypothetical protein
MMFPARTGAAFAARPSNVIASDRSITHPTLLFFRTIFAENRRPLFPIVL